MPGTDPEQRLLTWKALPIDKVRDAVAESRASTRVLILDCCFSGRAINAQTDGFDVVFGQVDISGTYTITSSSRTEPSYFAPGHRNTAFTAALIAVATQHPGIALDDLYLHLQHHLRSNAYLEPRRQADNSAGRLVLFAPRTHPPSPKTSTQLHGVNQLHTRTGLRNSIQLPQPELRNVGQTTPESPALQVPYLSSTRRERRKHARQQAARQRTGAAAPTESDTPRSSASGGAEADHTNIAGGSEVPQLRGSNYVPPQPSYAFLQESLEAARRLAESQALMRSLTQPPRHTADPAVAPQSSTAGGEPMNRLPDSATEPLPPAELESTQPFEQILPEPEPAAWWRKIIPGLHDRQVTDVEAQLHTERDRIDRRGVTRDQSFGVILDVICKEVRKTTARGNVEDWDLEGLLAKLKTLYPVSVQHDEITNGHADLAADEVLEILLDDIWAAYLRRESEIDHLAGTGSMRNLERQVLLALLDRSIGQDDIGAETVGRIKEDFVEYLFNLTVELADG
ncbi:hypothetical protein ACIA5E_18125 [Nocardia asteroides]|uniref:hypothetical protein n=1 Tax=Nocardia asteroides TaxID=1824 RepID=UPI00379C2400